MTTTDLSATNPSRDPRETLEGPLEHLLSGLPERLGVIHAAVHAISEGTCSRLCERVHTTDEPRDPVVDDDALRGSLAEPTALLDDQMGGDVATWIRVRLPFDATLHLMLGTPLPASAITPGDLARVEGAANAIRGAYPAPKAPLDTALAQLANAIPQPILLTDEAGRVLSANDNFAFLYGWSDAEITGRPLRELLPREHSDTFEDALRATLDETGATEVPLPPPEGDLGSLSFTLTALRLGSPADGAGSTVLFVLREVSAGLELSRLRNDHDQRTYLFRVLLHDLKSPLSALQNGVDLVSASASNPPALEEILRILDSSMTRLRELLEDFSEYAAQLPHETEHRLPILLPDLIDGVLDGYLLAGHPHALKLDALDAGKTLGQRPRLTRAFDNLVSNAVKYSPEGGEIRVTIAPDSDPDWIRVTVEDHGLGIAPELLQKIWEPFYRPEEPRLATIEGTGLGLAIVRQIIEQHEGTIEVESEPGVGSVFTVRLPRH